jgi:hypothetical protein
VRGAASHAHKRDFSQALRLWKPVKRINAQKVP